MITDWDLVKFCAERAHAESAILWTRNGLLLTVEMAALGIVSGWAFDAAVPKGRAVLMAVVLLGLTLVWMHMHHAGRRLNHLWMQDAVTAATKVPELAAVKSLKDDPDDGTPLGGVKHTGLIGELLHPDGGASWWFFVLQAGFVVSWVYVGGAAVWQWRARSAAASP